VLEITLPISGAAAVAIGLVIYCFLCRAKKKKMTLSTQGQRPGGIIYTYSEMPPFFYEQSKMTLLCSARQLNTRKPNTVKPKNHRSKLGPKLDLTLLPHGLA
jgi:hypothetical protein